MKYEIEKFDPCSDALEFRAKYSSFEQAWNECPRGDWMLWLAKRLDVDFKILTKAKAKCALTVRHLMKDERSIKACEIALKFSDGLATRDELDAAADAAYAAADAAYAAAAYAAYAAADDAAYAAYAAADAAYAAADDAAYAAYAAARTKNQLETANICRELLTDSVLSLLK
jgi:hypothetical protein